MAKAKTLMIQGTTSYSGKSLMVTGFCKIFRDMGYRVAPFKSQNMSLNSYVTLDGAEIARSQATQAFAAGVEPTAEMNPILLKPRGDSTSQVVLMGRPYADYDAKNYYREFTLREGIKAVKQAFDRLAESYDIVIIEGAGSPAEINLYEREIANMRIAELTRSPVLMVADIDRGGVFASIVGTLKLLKPRHRRRVKGFLINKFRGDITLLEPGITELERITKKKVLGVIPYLTDLILPDEDSVALQEKQERKDAEIVVGVIKLPRISNFTDFDPLLRTPGIELRYITKVEEMDSVDSIIIPGTKNTLSDLAWLKEKKLDQEILEHAKSNHPILGICGGYQMLGKKILDQGGVEGKPGVCADGLNLLDISTIFDVYEKTTTRVEMIVARDDPLLPDVSKTRYEGYEIHMGKIRRGRDTIPIFRIVRDSGRTADRLEGTSSKEGHVLGTNIHGLFDNRPILDSFIGFLAGRRERVESTAYKETGEIWTQSLETLTSTMYQNLNLNEIIQIMGLAEKSL